MQSTEKLPVIGLDIAKNVFQLHIVDAETGEIQRRQLKRGKVAEFFANRQPSLVALEACGGAHHWARTLLAMGHQVKLLPAKHVKAFLLRGLLYEFGIVLPVGHAKLLQSIQGELAHAQQHNRLPGIVMMSVQEQLKRINAMQDDIDELTKRLGAMLKQNQQMLAVQAIPGIGALTATALVATVGDVSTFRSGRQFAAWLGLTPRQVGTGGKTQQLGISKQGDSYLRNLLINGARAIVGRSSPTSWMERLLQRRHFNVVVTAVANKMARTVWAVLAKGVAFDQVKWNPAETAAV